MAEITVRAACANHPDELAVATCDHCARPVCGRCRRESVTGGEDYCSQKCAAAQGLATHEQLLPGFDHPFRTGWAVWARSAWALTRHIALLVVVIVAFSTVGDVEVTARGLFVVPVFVFGIALTDAVLSQQYTGIVRGNAYLWTLQRLIPWAVTWVLMMVATLLGTVALVVPGIIAGLRLFWSDEFALAHRLGPIESLKESWQLTRGNAGEVFVFQFLSGLATWLVVVAGFAAFAAMSFVFAILSPLGAVLDVLSAAAAVMLVFLGYGAVHAPEMAKFYGMHAVKTLGHTGRGDIVSLGLGRRR